MSEESTTEDTLLTQNNTDAGEDQTTDADKKSDEDDKSTDDDKKSDEDDKSTDDDKKSDEDDKSTEGAPETYEDFNLPEGVEMDKALLDEFAPVAKELNLSQEQAQKLVDLQAKNVQDFADAQAEAIKQVQKDWIEETKADKDLGGAKFDENLSVAEKAVSTFGSEALKNILNQSGLGNHPEVVRFCYKIGKAIAEDKFVEGETKGEPKPFYDKSDHKR